MKTEVTASRVRVWRRHLAAKYFLGRPWSTYDGLCDAVTNHGILFLGLWHRHEHLLTPSCTVPSIEIWDFAVFFTFMLQKRPKWLLFQNSLSKYLKSQKERFRAIFDQINSDSGLNDPLKTDHFSPYHIPLHLRFLVPKQMRFYSSRKTS